MKFLLKHPRLFLWYGLILPLSILMIVLMLIVTVCMFVIACFAVIENLLFRFEIWAKYNEKDCCFNTPYKTPLRKVFQDAFDGT